MHVLDVQVQYIFAGFALKNLLPHFIPFCSTARIRCIESVHSNGALKWFNFYIVANDDHDTVSQN